MKLEKLYTLVSNARYKEFEEYLTYLKERAVTTMAYADDTITIHRCQGQVATINQLLKLKTNVLRETKGSDTWQ
jgi:predicted nucleic acid-binding protein